MDSGSSRAVPGAGRGQGDVGGGDRLSRLGDAALGHILSFLPATEAARTATLSRRWRHVFAAVHALSFREAEACFRMGNKWSGRCGNCDGDVPWPSFVAGVSDALHGRHRGTRAATAPLRALRVTFDELGFRGGADATKSLDSWLSYTLYGAGEALEIDLRLATVPVCERAYALGSGRPDDDATMAEEGHAAAADEAEPCPYHTKKYIMPRSLFSCAVLRALRLDGCWINLPSAIALPSLSTLHLTRVIGRRGAIQHLLSACPSLVDLTLEACGNLTELSIDGARLRRLTLRCCHGLATINVSSSELRTFEYRGVILAEPLSPPFLTMDATPRKVSFCTLDFCGVESTAKVFGLMELFAGVERLHRTSTWLGSSFIGYDGAFPFFPMLRNLEITGMLPDYDNDASVAVSTVARILEGTPRLETLSLFFLPEPEPVKESRYRIVQPLLQLSSSLAVENPPSLPDFEPPQPTRQ